MLRVDAFRTVARTRPGGTCRVGFYFRVPQEGEVGAGDGLELVESEREKMTVRDICHLDYFDPKNLEDCKRALRIEALSPGWREGFAGSHRKAARL